jgi:HK97 family phage major capsid protein
MKRLMEIRARLAEIKAKLLELDTRSEDLTDTETTEYRAHLDEWDTLTAEAEPLEADEKRAQTVRDTKVAEVRQRAEVPGNRVPGSQPDDDHKQFNINIRNDADPYDLTEIRSLQMLGADPVKAAGELRARALVAIERESTVMEDRHKENATRLVQRAEGRDGVARFILLTGSDAYRSAFEECLRHPTMPDFDAEQRTAFRATEELRAALTLTGANGGYLVPFLLDPSIILTNNGATNPMREIATVKTIDVNVWHGVASAGVTAEWIAEATEVADATPTFSQPTITCFKADAYIQGSWEVIADSGISGELGMLIADAKDRLEAAAFVTGSGSGQPTGVVTAIAAVTASRVAGSSGAAGAADYVVGDVYAVQNALPPRYRQNSSWLSEQTTYNKTRQFATGTGPSHAFWADLGVAIPPLLLGRPAYEASAMDNTIVSGSTDNVLLLADFRRAYTICDRIGMTMLYEPLVKGASFRPTGQSAWVAYWRTGGDSTDPNAGRLLVL